MSDRVTVEGNTKGRGRPRLTSEVVVQKDFGFWIITEHDALDRAQWRKQIHVTDLKLLA